MSPDSIKDLSMKHVAPFFFFKKNGNKSIKECEDNVLVKNSTRTDCSNLFIFVVRGLG